MTTLTEAELDELERLEAADCLDLRRWSRPDVFADYTDMLPKLIALARKGLASETRLMKAAREAEARVASTAKGKRMDLYWMILAMLVGVVIGGLIVALIARDALPPLNW